ncbi:MAG: TetR/AcrR family transcriptional regulator [Thiotrichales bacterium]|nr:TetR/AcrR family transcriptional regulator [Thiotrichales bacterium]
MVKNTDARIRRSHAAIVKAGRELLNKNSEASLTDIANHAGVGRATLYRLFDTKEKLIKAIVIDCLQVFDEATAHIESESHSALEAIHLMFKAIIPLTEEQQFLMNLSAFNYEDKDLQKIVKGQEQEMIDLVDLAKQEGSIDKNMPSEWIINVIDALFYPAWLLREEKNYSNDTLTDLAFRTFCSGFAAQK